MRRWTVAVVAGLTLSLLAGPSTVAQADDIDVQTPAVLTPVTVSVPIRTINTPDKSGQNGVLELQVGKSAPISVIVDTGIVGLVLFEKPTFARATGIKATTFHHGSKLPGLLFTAPVTIGGVTTVGPVAIQYVNTSNPYIRQLTNRGIAGIIGLGVGDGGRMTNILKSMPGSFGLRWSLHFDRTAIPGSPRTGALVLGAIPPTDVRMFFNLPYVGVDLNGAREWNDHAAPGCWTFGIAREKCVDTWFDSGFTVMRILGRQFWRVPETPTHELRPGTRVKLAARTSAFYGHVFIAGNKGSRNLARVINVGRGTVNTGNSFYFDYTVTYDQVFGTISLSATRGR
jgi:hypothetical protein